MNTRQQVETIISDFAKEYEGRHGIWGIAPGAGPREYDEWGKPRHKNKNEYIDWALHVYTNDHLIEEHIGNTYKGVQIMFFYNNE